MIKEEIFVTLHAGDLLDPEHVVAKMEYQHPRFDLEATRSQARWSEISGDLPDAPVNAIVVDPRQSSTLYVGSDVGTFVSNDLGASWFYTDSYTDLPMLERVAHRVAVNPDPRLRRTARSRGWPVEDWIAAATGA